MRSYHLVVGILLGFSSACTSPLQPAGDPNPQALALEQANWLSSDTIISINPQTMEETVRVNESDLSPEVRPDGTVIYKITEYLPVYASCKDDPDPALCTQRALNAFVRDNLVYPRWAQVEGVEGSAIATFVIGPDGRVGDTGIERSMGDRLDAEVLKLVGRLPVWHPGFHNGEPVAVRYRLPVTFSLPESD